MGALTIIKDTVMGIIKPVTDMVDNLNTSDEEKLQLHNELAKLQATIDLELDKAELEVQKSYHQIIMGEQKSDSWITRTWRPIVGLGYMALIFFIYGIPAVKGETSSVELPEMFWVAFLGVMGITIYGRSWEKVAKIKKR